MSDIDRRALESNFENWRKERAPHLPQDKAFELFAIDQILKDSELTDEQVSSGLTGGADDGGIDGVYFFIDRNLILDESDSPASAQSAQLYLIQAKYESGFKETAIERMHSFARDLLDYSKAVSSLTYLNAEARDAITRFREKYELILASQHSLTITFCYASKSDSQPNPKVLTRVENLKAYVKSQLSAAKVEFDFWDCNRLLTAARTAPTQKLVLDITRHFATADEAVVCLATLTSFYEFLVDSEGKLRRNILEPNVRDYQGPTPVNKEIRDTLRSADKTEFWWLNNGVTILASSNSVTGDKLSLEKPEIVNGLQTSHEIFVYFSENKDKIDNRNILIKVLKPLEEQTRTRITKATNFQTQVNPVSLHATDPLHFDIEDKLKLYGFFYDRRPGHYRNQKKPIKQIISYEELARPIIAIILRQPNFARSSPRRTLKSESQYNKIYNPSYNRDIYVAAILLDRQVEQYLDRQTDMQKDARRDIRYYALFLLTCELVQCAEPNPNDLAGLVQQCVTGIPDHLIESTCNEAYQAYLELGGTDKVAKGTELNAKLVSRVAEKYPPKFPDRPLRK
jgi:hypothetical protein